MKKIVWIALVATCLVACMNRASDGSLKSENDSLRMELVQRGAELDEMMGVFNQISEGFRQINEAEGRVDLQRGVIGEGSLTAQEQIARDVEFISNQMAENREQIAKLQQQLKNSKNNSVQLKKAIEALSAELNAKALQIKALQDELAAKNIKIEQLDSAVTMLSSNNALLTAQNAQKQKTVEEQDAAIHTAWFVFGTKKELRENKILTSGEVLKSDFNKEYFTQIDIRTTTEVKLFSKSASVLTSHPAGSYELVKDNKGELTFRITDTSKFWSISKYLVIQVR